MRLSAVSTQFLTLILLM